MGLITETSLRAEIRNKSMDKYVVKPGTKITPSARQYLKDRKIELVVEEQNTKIELMQPQTGNEEKLPARYVFADAGCYMNEKPEYMTQLYGKRLVYKNHPRIVLRGAIDSLQSSILLLQAEAAADKTDKLVRELDEVLQYVRNIMRCEVLEEKLPAIKLIGLEDEELRTQSHNPAKYFNMKHALPEYGMGKLALELNALRSNIREVETCAVTAFRKDDGIDREDIIKALNRLSSGVYIMMLKYLSGAYR
ncbi:MAG TPA: cobalamin adenosyltransferase [Clostridia bacterium]|nr:cobalamin adenosyltransferase [Clostridia bacterium]